MGDEEASQWAHLKSIAKRISQEFPDAVFIGGLATYFHAFSLGEEFREASHDADLYLSLAGKSELRDRYEVRRSTNRNLVKDSVLIEGEDLDLYVEHQHNLGIPYANVFAHSEMSTGVRVAALEHLFLLKLDAARDRWGTGKGQKDVRDVAKIVALLSEPRKSLLKPYYLDERDETLTRIGIRRDLPELLGLETVQGSHFRKKIDAHIKKIRKVWIPERDV